MFVKRRGYNSSGTKGQQAPWEGGVILILQKVPRGSGFVLLILKPPMPSMGLVDSGHSGNIY